MPFTDEQECFMQFKPERSARGVVRAYAGCGKTFILEEYAKRHPDKRFLYLVFNKSVREEAQKKFPNNVVCMTSHALATSRFKHYRDKTKLDIKTVEYRELMGEDDWRVVKLAINGLVNFMNSADPAITSDHVIKGHDTDKDKIPQSRIDTSLRAARNLWKQQIDPSSDVPCTNNTLLKLYQLSEPDLDKTYDVILFDEGQDANPVTLDFVKKNKCALIIVGDGHQMINRWRGAENALEVIEDDGAEVFRLTNSFRFGPLVAALANVVLFMKGETYPLKGLGPVDEICTPEEILQSGFHAILSRTYMGVIQSAYESIQMGKRVMWNGGIKKYNLDELLDLHSLKIGRKELIKNSNILRDYGNWGNYIEMAESTKDVNMVRAIRLMETYVDIPGMVETMRANEARNEREADVLISTGHSVKGLEYDNVYINDDFPSILEMIYLKRPAQSIIDEMNLLYVVITRARKKINIIHPLAELMEEYHNRQAKEKSVVLLR